MDFSSICRICLKPGELISMFNTVEQSLNVLLSSMISSTTSINIEIPAADQVLPSHICVPCLRSVKVAYQLRVTSEESDTILRSYSLSDDILTDGRTVIIEEEELPTAEPLDAKPISFLANLPPDLDCITEVESEIEDDIVISEDQIEYVAESEDGPGSWLKFEGASDENETENVLILYEEDHKPPTEKEPIKPPHPPPNRPIRNRKGVEDFTCTLCGAILSSKAALNSHLNRHRNERNYMCSFCEKRFINTFEMKRHERTHTGEKRYPCKYCEKKFTDFTTMKRHQNSHTDSRPYSCPHCDKSFAYSHVLRNHMLIHTGDKNYECTVCLKKFAHNHHLKSHMKTHSKPQLLNKRVPKSSSIVV